MKVLLDENLPHELRRELSGHEVFTVQYMGWSGVKNGLLLGRAAKAGFDVMVTMDSGVPYQQNLALLPYLYSGLLQTTWTICAPSCPNYARR